MLEEAGDPARLGKRRCRASVKEDLMKTLATIAVCLSVATPVLAQSVGEKTGVNSLLGVTPSTQDFVTEAAASDMFEIQSSQMAVERADEPTKRFARQMITDHQKTSTELKSLIQAGTVK